jgi:hypothetical protein
MNARFAVTSLFAIVVVGLSALQAAAAVGTAKARGDFSSWQANTPTRSVARSRPAPRYFRAPVQTAPAIVAAPVQPLETAAPQVAQAPTTGQRFSYAPAPATAAPAATTPCPELAVAPQAGRRYSYAPQATVAPATSAPAYASGPVYSRAPRVSSTPLWALPKTDARKFNAR